MIFFSLSYKIPQSSREEPSSPTRAPGVRQLADTFHLDARVHKKGNCHNHKKYREQTEKHFILLVKQYNQ